MTTGRRSSCTPRPWPSPGRPATATTRAARSERPRDLPPSLGDYRQAIELHTQALAIARETGNRTLQGSSLTSLGDGHASLGDYRHAIELYTQALAIAAMGDVASEAVARSNLAGAHLAVGEPELALAPLSAEPNRRLPREEPKRRLFVAVALLELGRTDDATADFNHALDAAAELLVLTDANVAALRARAVALAGLAAIGSDPARAEEARASLARIRTVTTADGDTAQDQQLLDLVVTQDASGILDGIRAVEVDWLPPSRPRSASRRAWPDQRVWSETATGVQVGLDVRDHAHQVMAVATHHNRRVVQDRVICGGLTGFVVGGHVALAPDLQHERGDHIVPSMRPTS